MLRCTYGGPFHFVDVTNKHPRRLFLHQAVRLPIYKILVDYHRNISINSSLNWSTGVNVVSDVAHSAIISLVEGCALCNWPSVRLWWSYQIQSPLRQRVESETKQLRTHWDGY